MTYRRIPRRSREAASLLCVFLLAGIGACSSGPSTGKLKGIATSDEVRGKRERAERELRARAGQIGQASPWGPALRTTVVDECARGGGKNYLDPNAPDQPAMTCRMRLHLYFVVDRPVPQVLRELRTMKTPTVWNEGSVGGALQYYEQKRYEKPHAYRPGVTSLDAREALAWDAPGDDKRLKVAEACAKRKVVFGTCTSDPADVTLSALRERPGTLFEWTLNTDYHSVSGK